MANLSPYDMVRRLAISQARGERQLSFVNELLSFDDVSFEYFRIPGLWGPGGYAQTPRYGVSRLEHRSWMNLRKRLVSVGFVVKTDRESNIVRLTFPELTAR